MTSIPLPLVDGDTLFIDNSSLEHFVTCPRAAQYAICSRKRPTGERVALTFGGIIHKVLETRYRASTPLSTQTAQVTSLMIATAEREFAKWSPPEDDFRTFSTAVELIRRYEENYPFEQFDVVRAPDGTPMIEMPFALPLGEIETSEQHVKVVWMGRIDLAYVSTNGGGFYLMDHKTTSVMGPSYFNSFQISHQLYGYAWAAEQITGSKVEACVINAIGVRKPTKTGKAFEFARQTVNIQRGLLTEWKVDCLHIVADFIEMARRGYMPKHTAWCQGKFGECPFFKVCTLETDEQREVMLNSGEFVENTWTPLKS